MSVQACSLCGTPAPDTDGERVASGWALQTDRGTPAWLCTACARRHVRDIEAKLDDEYWT